MITKNGSLLLIPQNTNNNKIFKCEDGNNSSGLNPSGIPLNISHATYGINIDFGTGTTRPTKDDYVLESPLTSSVTVSVISRSNTSQNLTYSDVPSILFVTALVTNETGDDISISEIGMYMLSTTSSSGKKILLTRTVLDDAMVLESGKTYQITVAIN